MNIPTPPELTTAVAAALDKQAENLVVLDLRGLSDVTDFFLICEGNSDRQVLAIAESVESRLRSEHRRRPSHVEGRRQADWVLMDYVDIVVHVFTVEKRQFYRLDRLWGDAPTLIVCDEQRLLADGPPGTRSGSA